MLLDSSSSRMMSMSNQMPLAMDIKETEKEFIIAVDVPGCKKKDIHIDIEDHHLMTIKADRSEETTFEEQRDDITYRKTERFIGVQTRSLILPDNIDDDLISTKFDHGVLQIHIPKVIIIHLYIFFIIIIIHHYHHLSSKKKGEDVTTNENKKKIEIH